MFPVILSPYINHYLHQSIDAPRNRGLRRWSHTCGGSPWWLYSPPGGDCDDSGDCDVCLFNIVFHEFTLWWTNILPWKDPPFFMGKSTISTGPFSIAMLVHHMIWEVCAWEQVFPENSQYFFASDRDLSEVYGTATFGDEKKTGLFPPLWRC